MTTARRTPWLAPTLLMLLGSLALLSAIVRVVIVIGQWKTENEKNKTFINTFAFELSIGKHGAVNPPHLQMIRVQCDEKWDYPGLFWFFSNNILQNNL